MAKTAKKKTGHEERRQRFPKGKEKTNAGLESAGGKKAISS